MTTAELQQSHAVILSHYATTGACEELRDWLNAQRVRRVTYVAFPFGARRARPIVVEHYRAGELHKRCHSLWRWQLPEALAYGKDFLYALYYTLKLARRTDVVVAGDNLLTVAALATRWLTHARRVVYYMIDYTPVRYANKLLNALYWRIDRWAAHHATQVWPLTRAMIEARFTARRLCARRVRWQVVPFGTHPMATGEYAPHSVIYLGDIMKNKGVELFVPLALKLRELVPDFKFVVVGGGPDLAALRKEVERGGLAAHFEIHGFVASMDTVLRILARAAVALAPYYPDDRNSFTHYADPGKIKVYLGCALPIVLTDVPPIARELVAAGAGRVVAYDANEFACRVAEVMRSDGYGAMREAARQLGDKFAWERVLPQAFARLDHHPGEQGVEDAE